MTGTTGNVRCARFCPNCSLSRAAWHAVAVAGYRYRHVVYLARPKEPPSAQHSHRAAPEYQSGRLPVHQLGTDWGSVQEWLNGRVVCWNCQTHTLKFQRDLYCFVIKQLLCVALRRSNRRWGVTWTLSIGFVSGGIFWSRFKLYSRFRLEHSCRRGTVPLR
jgi:hypothetical protein